MREPQATNIFCTPAHAFLVPLALARELRRNSWMFLGRVPTCTPAAEGRIDGSFVFPPAVVPLVSSTDDEEEEVLY